MLATPLNDILPNVLQILKEQTALNLKQMPGSSAGVVLDSNKPHLVGIDEDVLSTGITLYHLKVRPSLLGFRYR